MMATLSVANTSKWADKTDWEQNRAVITQLYAKHTLPKVMEIMERQGFNATCVYHLRSRSAFADRL